MDATTNEQNTAPDPIKPMIFSFLIAFPNKPLIRKPINGKRGISHTLSNIPDSFCMSNS
jgi:hypothetical protein